jgi:hypothetical protein
VALLPEPRDSLRDRILALALDESAVWALTSPVTAYRRIGPPIDRWPSARADELRPELEALLREGKVELFPSGGSGPALALEDALEEIERDDAWLPPLESGRDGFEVILTATGAAEARRTANAAPVGGRRGGRGLRRR